MLEINYSCPKFVIYASQGAPEEVPEVQAWISNVIHHLPSQKLNIHAGNQLFVPQINHTCSQRGPRKGNSSFDMDK